jgi:hypothetical protein
VICNFVCSAPCIAYLVGPVEPVELREICRAQVEPRRVTGGTGAGLPFYWRISVVPPVTPTGPPKITKKPCNTTGSTSYPTAGGLARDRTPFGRSLESIS